jgi:hypothetical protein
VTIVPTRALLACALVSAAYLNAEDLSAQKTIRDLYASVFVQMREVKTKPEPERLLDSIDAPEWVGKMPAGETLTRGDAIKDGESVLTLPPAKRPIPKMQITWIRETGWNTLVVCWRYRVSGQQTIGALYRDSWVRTAAGWRRNRTEKFFPDRMLAAQPGNGAGKDAFLPDPE